MFGSDNYIHLNTNDTIPIEHIRSMVKLEFNEIHSVPAQIWFQIEQTQNEKQNQRIEYNHQKKSQIKI